MSEEQFAEEVAVARDKAERLRELEVGSFGKRGLEDKFVLGGALEEASKTRDPRGVHGAGGDGPLQVPSSFGDYADRPYPRIAALNTFFSLRGYEPPETFRNA